MALQKRRLGRSRTRSRRSQWMRRAGEAPLVGACASCGEPKVPHRVCMSCGQYKGQSVMEVKKDEE